MIVVAIVSILATIAYPSYTDYVLRGRLVDATNALAGTRAQMEQFYQDNRTYVGGPCNTPQSAGVFTVSCLEASTATAYTITAQGREVAAGASYTIDHRGRRTSTPPSRWGSGEYNCWVLRRGQSC
jgi:type IV pilus assembly protein PilE